MGNAFAGLLGGLFISLCIYCYPHAPGAMPGKVRGITGHHAAKQVYIWRDKKTEIIADIYHVSLNEVDKPVKIFGD